MSCKCELLLYVNILLIYVNLCLDNQYIYDYEDISTKTFRTDMFYGLFTASIYMLFPISFPTHSVFGWYLWLLVSWTLFCVDLTWCTSIFTYIHPIVHKGKYGYSQPIPGITIVTIWHLVYSLSKCTYMKLPYIYRLCSHVNKQHYIVSLKNTVNSDLKHQLV